VDAEVEHVPQAMLILSMEKLIQVRWHSLHNGAIRGDQRGSLHLGVLQVLDHPAYKVANGSVVHVYEYEWVDCKMGYIVCRGWSLDACCPKLLESSIYPNKYEE
jgi:hypothetical protein